MTTTETLIVFGPFIALMIGYFLVGCFIHYHDVRGTWGN